MGAPDEAGGGGGGGSGLGLGLPLARGGRAGPQFDFSAGTLPAGAVATRASPGSRVDADGRIATLPADGARFDHDPVGGRRLGLLVEPATLNRIPWSQDFAHPAWLVFRGLAKIGTVPGIAPDGGPAMRIAFGPDSASALYQQVASGAAGGSWTASCWVRAAAGTTSVRLGINPGAGPVVFSEDREVVADRWIRLTLTATILAAQPDMSVRGNTAGTSADVLVWGAQFEPGTAATSYVVTGADPATRAADVLRLDWGGQGVADGPAPVRLFRGDGSVAATVATVVDGIATVPAQPAPLVAARLA